MEKTLIIIKPDGVERGMVGEIISRFERRGFRIGALKMVKVDRELAEQHYAVHKGKFFYDDLVKYISSSPVIVAVLEGPDVIKATRLMVGAHPGPPRRRPVQFAAILPYLPCAT